ncbi:hypothetical protein AB205_0148660, partial [Aquarana catesbeiana]
LKESFIVSGSQDLTLKIWKLPESISSKQVKGQLPGMEGLHAACTEKAHDKIMFVSRGTQLVTSGSDGLLKLWTIKTNECVKTLDSHEDKVWGLHSNKLDNALVTGSADSSIVLWKDVTETELAEELAKKEDEILKKQELSNLLHEKRFLKALGLAITLDQPHTALIVIKAILQEPQGKDDLEKNLLRLRNDQKEAILRYCTIWNTNSRNCHEAQCVLNILLTHVPPDTLLQYSGIRGTVEALIPY